MKVKTSVTLDEDLLRAVDKVARNGKSRSQVIEDATRIYLSGRARAAREARDLAILNAAADELNAEMDDVLTYQGDL
jgi:metal-responsive CopG/Arc/MetJ family transcriptional regulator